MPEVQELQNLGRAKNAIQGYLVRKLLYPKVYLDANWGGVPVDVLAIDRTGVGDVHAVRIAPVHFQDGPANWQEHVTLASMVVNENSKPLLGIPGHFRYIALFNETADLRRFDPPAPLVRLLTAADGIGRIGLLVVDLGDGEPVIKEIVRAERFRSSKHITELTDHFIASNEANWEMRE